MVLKIFTSIFLGTALFASPAFAYTSVNNSTTIGISVLVPERAEDQKCIIGFENSIDNSFTSLKSTGCLYNSKELLQTAYQQTSSFNIQGFTTVVITAP